MENCIKAISFLLVFIAIFFGFTCIAGGGSQEPTTEIATLTVHSDTLIASEAITKLTSQTKEQKTSVTTEKETTSKKVETSECNIRKTTKSTTAKSTTALTTEPHTSKLTSKKHSKYLGTFKLTAYCPCSQCCGKWANGITATGVIAKPNHTIAVDPRVIPYGSKVIINGYEYVAEDCGGAIKQNRIDVYFATHQEACDFGVQYAEVYLVVD